MIQKLTVEEYNALDAINASLLCLLDETSLAHVAAHLKGQRVQPVSEACKLGDLFHKWILEPEKVATSFHIKPYGIKLNTIEGKIWKFIHSTPDPTLVDLHSGMADLFNNCFDGSFTDAGLEELSSFWKKIPRPQKQLIEDAKPDRPFVDESDISHTRGMAESVMRDKEIAEHIQGCQAEVTLTVTDKDGVKRKARLDLFKAEGPVIPDFKRARSAKPEDFVKASYELGYWIRAAYYVDVCRLLGIEKKTMLFIAVEPNPPYIVQPFAFHDLPGSFLRVGRIRYRALLKTLTNAMRDNHWPRYEPGFVDPELKAPKWLIKELESV